MSKIKLLNNQGDIVTIEHSDTLSKQGNLVVNIKDVTKQVDTIADLKALDGTHKLVYVTGYHTKGDGAFGSHVFEWDATSTEVDNGGTVIKLDGVTTGRYKLKYNDAINVKWFGLIGDDSTDNTPAFNAMRYHLKDGDWIYFPNGAYAFKTRPADINITLKITGDGKSSSRLRKRFNTTTSSDGVINLRDGSAGSIISDLAIASSDGSSSGGCLISMVASATGAPDYCKLSNLYLSTSGYNTHEYTVYIDGSLRTGAPIGVRDTFIENCSIFGATHGAILLKSVVACHLNSVDTFRAGGTTGKVMITGTSSVNSYYVDITSANMDGLNLTYCNFVNAQIGNCSGDIDNTNTANSNMVSASNVTGFINNFWTNSLIIKPETVFNFAKTDRAHKTTFDIKEPGLYSVFGSGLSDAPDGGTATYWGTTVSGNGSTIVSQIAVERNTGATYIRSFANSTAWTSWTRMDVKGQSYQDVTNSRGYGVTYTNNTGLPIQVVITARNTTDSSWGNLVCIVDGITISVPRSVNNSSVANTSFIVPNGSTYEVSNSGTTLDLEYWVELR